MADELTPYQRDILIKTILGEARGEGETGMAAVAHNILNRAKSGRYPSDPAEVALEPKQYSTWNSGEGGNNPGQFKPGSKAYETAAQVLERVVGGEIPDMTGGALQYHAKSVTPYWADEANTNGALKVGNHVFYPTRPVPPGDIPNTVGTQLDVRRTAPAPAQQSLPMASLRANTSPSGGNDALQAALNRMATARGNQVTPADAFDRVTARNKAPAVSASDLTRGSEPQTRNNATTIASIPSRPQVSASDMARGRNGYETIATYPTAGIGQPPATRVVQSVPVSSPRTASDRARGSEPQTRNNATTIATIPTGKSLLSPGAVDASVTSLKTDPALDAAMKRLQAQKQAVASDKVRGNEMQTREVAQTIATIPSKPQISASDMARGNSLNTPAVLTEKDIGGWGKSPSGMVFNDGAPVPERLLPPINNSAPERLTAQAMGLNAQTGLPMFGVASQLQKGAPAVQSGGVSRDGLTNRLMGMNTPSMQPDPVAAARIAPSPMTRPQQRQQQPLMAAIAQTLQRPSSLSQPSMAMRKAPIAPVQMTPVQQYQAQGMSSAQAYEAANEAARESARQSSGRTGRQYVETADGMQWR
jgi:hypothetical protein